MKNRNTLFRFMAGFLAIAWLTACSKEQEHTVPHTFSPDGIPLSLYMDRSVANPADLVLGLYIFSRTTGITDTYRLDSIILPLRQTSRLKFSNAELIRKEYRFLFWATPPDKGALKVVGTDRIMPPQGTSWEDIRVIPLTDSISPDNYYQVTDYSAEKILTADTLHGHLSRMVGQMVFRFFKIGENITDTQPIDQKKVTSVFDRIKNIRIDYENYPTALAFDEQGVPRPESVSAKQTITQYIRPVLQDYRLVIPQAGLDPVNGNPAEGGEIKGYCFLPAGQQIRTTLTFTYYDTTPICGNPTSQHEESCYAQDKIILYIPKKTQPGLSVESNAYTVNKAGIRCDRIIDIDYGTNMELETDWN